MQKRILEKSLFTTLFEDTNHIQSLFQEDREINRLLFNFLSVAKMYIDQLQTTVRSINENLLATMKQKISDFQNKDISNKLMIAIRNTMQHYGIVCSITSGYMNIQATGRFLFSYKTLFLNNDKFLADSKNRKEYESQISDKSKIEILDHLKYFYQNLAVLHSDIRKLISNDKNEAIKTLQEIYHAYTEKTGNEFDKTQELMQVYRNDEFEVITTNTIRFIEELETKNSNQTNSATRFACNISQSQLDVLRQANRK